MEHDQEIEITVGEPVADKVVDCCMGTDNRRYYKIQWRATWESEEDVLLKYQNLVEEYWNVIENKEEKDVPLSKHSDTPDNIEKNGDGNDIDGSQHYSVDYSLGSFYRQVNSPEHKVEDVVLPAELVKTTKPPPLMPQKWQSLEDRPFKCEDCYRSYSTEKKLKEHHRKLHVNKGTYQCSFCPKLFPNKRNLQNHMNRHTGIGPHSCPGCTKRFMTEQELMHHKRSCNYLVEKGFKCDVCQKSFATKPHLSFHQKIHLPDDEKPFKCQYCPRTFAYNHDCVHHMRLHIGEKPFKCIECEEAFHRKSYLTEHMFVHTGISKYRCSDCNQYFKTQQMLQTHVKNIHILKKTVNNENEKKNKNKKMSNGDRYKCEECSKVFRYLKEFHYHQAINHKSSLKNKDKVEFTDFEPTMVYKCKKCDKSFQWSTALKKHSESHKCIKTVENDRELSEATQQGLDDQTLLTEEVTIEDALGEITSDDAIVTNVEIDGEIQTVVIQEEDLHLPDMMS